MERPVILYTPDYEWFSKGREFWIDYEEIAPANKIFTFVELQEEIIKATNMAPPSVKYLDSLDKLHTVRDGRSCKKIYSEIIEIT